MWNKINEAFLDRSNLQGEWLLDWNWNDTSWNNNATLTNISFWNADRWYAEEKSVWNWISSTWVLSSNLIPSWTTRTLNFWINPDTVSWWTSFSSTNPRYLYQSNTWWTWQNGVRLLWETIDVFLRDWWVKTARTGNILTAGVWQMITVVIKPNSKIGIYLNWVKQTNSGFDDTLWATWNNGSTFVFWYEATVGQRYYDWDMNMVRQFNSELSQKEIYALYLEGLRKLWPTNLLNRSQGFPKYSLPNLESSKVLEISKAQSGWTYYDQTGNWNNWTPTNVTDSAVGLNNVMSFNWTSSLVSINDSPSLDITSEIYLSTRVNTTKLWTQYLIVKRTANVNDGYELAFSWSWKAFVRFNQNSQWNTYRLDSLTNYDTSWKWEKWEATYDWSIIKIYRNWVLDNSVNATFTIWTNNTALQLWKNTWGWYLQWQMCNPVVYNKSFTENEIQQWYYSSKII